MKKIAIATVTIAAMVAVPAAAETLRCTPIKSVPFTIKSSGVFCLRGDLVTDRQQGFAIRIARSNVVLDLNGFRLRGKGGPGSTASGIFAKNKRNITIRNGTIQGFFRGIYLDVDGGTSFGHLVEKIRAVKNYFTGIQVEGESVLVRNNRVIETGSSDTTVNAYGIFLSNARNARVSNNTISRLTESNVVRGIYISFSQGVVIENNVITDFRTANGKHGIGLQNVTMASVINNQLLSPFGATVGITTFASGSDITCVNNVIDGFTNVDLTCTTIVGTQP